MSNEGGFLVPEISFSPVGKWQKFKYRRFPIRLWKYFPIKGENWHVAESIKTGRTIKSPAIKRFW